VSDPRRYRISDDTSVPLDVTDPLLWRPAIDVLAAHQPGRDGRCRNLQCAQHREACPASVAARAAMRLAAPSREVPQPHAVAEGATPPLAARAARTVSARGRATVPGSGFGWFTRPPLPAPTALAPPPAPQIGVLAAA